MTDTTGSSGWHIDPDDPTLYRYHDGNAWTNHTAPAIIPVSTPVAVAPAVVAQPASPQPVAPAASPPAVPLYAVGTGHVAGHPGVSPKSWTTAWLLSFFLGGWGVDRFYLGNTGMGVAKLLVGWLTLGIWPLIDFIVIVSKNAHDGMGLRVVADPGQVVLVPTTGAATPGVLATAAAVPTAGPPKTLSILSMVLSIIAVPLSLVYIGYLGAIAGLVIGVVAARREPHARGFWLTGIIVGGVVVVLLLVSLIATLIGSAIAAAQYNQSF